MPADLNAGKLNKNAKTHFLFPFQFLPYSVTLKIIIGPI